MANVLLIIPQGTAISYIIEETDRWNSHQTLTGKNRKNNLAKERTKKAKKAHAEKAAKNSSSRNRTRIFLPNKKDKLRHADNYRQKNKNIIINLANKKAPVIFAKFPTFSRVVFAFHLLPFKIVFFLARFVIACSQTLYFLFKVRRASVIKDKPQRIYWPPAKGVVVGEEENRL